MPSPRTLTGISLGGGVQSIQFRALTAAQARYVALSPPYRFDGGDETALVGGPCLCMAVAIDYKPIRGRIQSLLPRAPGHAIQMA